MTAKIPKGEVPAWIMNLYKSSKGKVITLDECRKILSKCKTSLSDEIIRERDEER